MDAAEREGRLANFRLAMAGMLRAAMDSGSVTREGASSIYLTAVVAVRQTMLDEDQLKATDDEFKRLIARGQSPN